MKNNTIINKKNILIDVNSEVCINSLDLITSDTFNKILIKFNNHIRKFSASIYNNIYNNDIDEKKIVRVFKELLLFNINEISIKIDSTYLLKYVEMFYNYWRKLTRYSVLDNSSNQNRNYSSFIKTNEDFNSLVITTYRIISENITMKFNRIYRQLIAGVNAGIVQNTMNNNRLKKYNILNNIKVIESVILHPPFITYPSQNTRSGNFKELFSNPLNNIWDINTSKYINIGIRVGKLNGLICVNSKFMDLAIGLINIFEFIEFEMINNIDFDFIYFFGNESSEEEGYYYDKELRKYVASVPMNNKYDYFGYLKKMILTLHNLTYMKNNSLPIHGSMIKIIDENNYTKNIIMIGDSGAGKSETIEAMNIACKNNSIEISIIFDDMGVLKTNEENTIVANGTEIGAFVRLDDLDSGYPYREIDRAIFMNPHKNNSRLIIPVATFNEIITDEIIDYVFYINNYEEKELTIIEEDYKNTFLQGRRKAKGTTEEEGLVDTYFSNPFGATQNQELTKNLVNRYFDNLKDSGTRFGVIYSQLGITGMEQKGPLLAASQLLKILERNKTI